MWAGLCACLVAGCASSPTQSRKVYDRYAELVAARTRAASSPAATPAETAERPSSKAVAKPAPTVAAKPAAKPAVKPAVKPAAKPASVAPPAPPPAPILPPPVRVMAPSPAEVPAPVKPVAAEAPAPEPAPPAEPIVEAPPAVPFSSGGVAYLLKVGDVIQIFLRGIPMPDAIEDVIDENGNVSLPLINEVQAAGMTAAELERNIRQIYLDQDIYRNISVTAVVPTRYYFIQGEIRGPGRFQLVAATRVSQAIAGAGGYTEYASGQVIIKRGGKIVKTIRNAKRLERTPGDDILLEADDIIEVRRSLW